MSDKKIPPEFWERADALIAVANEQIKQSTTGKVSSSMLYAAARFTAFNVAFQAESAEEMQENKKEAINYFVAQFEKMLIENMEDYIENFEAYNSEDS